MKKTILIAGTALAMLYSCNHNDSNNNQAVNPAPENKTVNIKLAELSSTKDFVCEMELAEGQIADTASYNGKLYGFCSTECKGEFLKEPSKYLTQQ